MTALANATASIVLAAVLLGCGSGGKQPAPSNPALFVGTWNVVAGLLSSVCSNGTKQTVDVTAPTTFVLGTSSDIVDNDAACPIMYDVAGDVATALPGQSCMRSEFFTKLNFDDATFTLRDGGFGAHAANGHLDRYNDITFGSPVNCTFNQTAMYKVQL